MQKERHQRCFTISDSEARYMTRISVFPRFLRLRILISWSRQLLIIPRIHSELHVNSFDSSHIYSGHLVEMDIRKERWR
jgi:hypothetical protein